MKKREVDHVLRAAGRITGEKQFIIIGSQSPRILAFKKNWKELSRARRLGASQYGLQARSHSKRSERRPGKTG